MHADKRAVKITGTAVKTRPSSWESLSVAAKYEPKSLPTAKRRPSRRNCASTGGWFLIYTDALKSYEGLSEFQHGIIDHAIAYVDGKIHTNGLENFWSLVKRGLRGTYISVEPFHLFRYLDEQVYRYNHRKVKTENL